MRSARPPRTPPMMAPRLDPLDPPDEEEEVFDDLNQYNDQKTKKDESKQNLRAPSPSRITPTRRTAWRRARATITQTTSIVIHARANEVQGAASGTVAPTIPPDNDERRPTTKRRFPSKPRPLRSDIR